MNLSESFSLTTDYAKIQNILNIATKAKQMKRSCTKFLISKRNNEKTANFDVSERSGEYDMIKITRSVKACIHQQLK